MAPCSNDLRERVAAAVDHGKGSQREIVRRFRVSLSFIVRLLEPVATPAPWLPSRTAVGRIPH